MHHKKFVVIGIVLIVLIGVIGLTYAYFVVGGTQEGMNSFTSGCFSISLENESESITLDLAEPTLDVDGLQGDTYSFTVKNNCNEPATYVINLESLNESETSLAEEFLKVSLSSETMDNVISLLADNPEMTPEIEGGYESHNLYIGTLDANASKSFGFKLWLDYDATVEAANKTYLSKINVIATTNVEDPKLPEIKFELDSGNIVGHITGEATDALYCLSTDQTCTPTESIPINDGKIQMEWPQSMEEQFMCVQLTNDSKNSSIYCSNPYSDINPPSDPLIAFDDNYNIVLSGSTDDQSEVTYYYSLDGNDYTMGDTITLDNSSEIYAYAADASGNKSNVVKKTLTINNAVNETPDHKYYCSYNGKYYDTQTEATNACKETVDASYTGSTRYYCSHNGTYQTSSTCSNTYQTSYTGSTRYYCSHNGSYQSSSVCSYSYTTTYTGSAIYNCGGSYQSSSTCTSSTAASTRTYYSCPNGSTSSSSTCSAANITTVQGYTCSCTTSSGYYYCSSGTRNGSKCNHSRTYATSALCRANCPGVCAGTDTGGGTGTTYCSWTTNATWVSGTTTCSGFRCTSNCDSNKSCPSGYTKGTATSSGSCGGSCSYGQTCSVTWTAPCTATGTRQTEYYCTSGTLSGSRCITTYTGTRYYQCDNGSIQSSSTCYGTATNNYTGDRYYRCNDGTYQTGSTCYTTTTDNYNGERRYYCSHTGKYQTSSLCSNTSIVDHDTNNKYYCSVTNKYYDTESEAQSACSNICSVGKFHNNKCYDLV